MKLACRALQAAAVAALALMTGCTAAEPVAATGKFFAVASEHAPFYRYGPQQANGPDQRLERDTLLTVIRPSFGYCKVQLHSGEQGYVAIDDLHVAPRELIEAATAPPPVIAQTHARKFRLDDNDPRLIAPPEPLPLDLPEPTPIPGTESSPGQVAP